jgi:putative spermidine/putrescine transport system substrate-binding protein
MADRYDVKTDHVSRRRFLAGSGSLALQGTILSALPLTQSALAEPSKPESVIVCAWGGNWQGSLDKGVSGPFTQKTGIKVLYDNTYNAEMRTKLLQALAQKRRPPVDVMWDISNEAAEAAMQDACIDLSDLPNLKEMSDPAIPKEFRGVPYISMYSYVLALVYVKSKFPDGAPTSWQVLFDPKFKGRIGLYNTGNGVIQLAAVAAGGKVSDYPDNLDAAWTWVEKLKAQDPLLGSDEDMTKWFQQGEVDLAITIVTNAIELKRSGMDLAWTVPREGAYYATDCLWVPKGLPEDVTYWAKEYVNFAMSPEAQQVWCAGLGLPGLSKGFKPPAEFAGDPAYPTSEEDFKHLFTLPVLIKVKHWGEWTLKYKSIMNL